MATIETCTCHTLGDDDEAECFGCDAHGALYTAADEAMNRLCECVAYIDQRAGTGHYVVDRGPKAILADARDAIDALRAALPTWHGC